MINTGPTDGDPSGADASYGFRHVLPNANEENGLL